jgi:sortase B
VGEPKRRRRKVEREAIEQVGAARPKTRREQRAEAADQRMDEAGRRRLSRILLIAGIALLLVAVAIAGTLIYQYLFARGSYEQISAASGLHVTTDEGVVDPATTATDLTFDWDAQRAINRDIVGWVLIPGTRVNYPIVQGPDNEYYLTHLFDSNASGVGAVFLDYEGSATLNARNNMIYGHNMLDGSMFADVTKFMDDAYFDAHRTVYVCTPAANYELRTFAIEVVSEQSEIRTFEFASDSDFQAYVSDLIRYASIVAPDRGELSSVYSFITCDAADSSLRIILNAELISSLPPTTQGA